MIPAEAVEAAARGMCGTHPLSQWEYKSQETRDMLLSKARMALEAAAPHMLGYVPDNHTGSYFGPHA